MKSLALSSLSFSLWAASKGEVYGDSRFLQERADSNCTTITEILCDNDGEYPTDTLCEAIQMAGIQNDLDNDVWTLFAPTNDAFEALPSEIVSALMGGASTDDTRELRDMLAFHVVPGLALESSDLKCDGRTFMANDEYSVTICEGDRVYQVGTGNPTTDYPEIVVGNIEACNGIIHLISEVMLDNNFAPTDSPSATLSIAPTDGPSSEPSIAPTDGPSSEPSMTPTDNPSDGPTSEPSLTPTDGPSDAPSPEPSATPTARTSASSVDSTKPPTPGACSLSDIACGSDEFNYLCAAITATGLDETFDEYNGNYTIFAPSDAAFEKLGDVAIAYLMDPDNVNLLTDILAFHTVEDEIIYSHDLKCKETIEMSNGKDSRSVCQRQSLFQKGKGNRVHHRPEVIEVDIETCNGVIHVINEVMLFDYVDELGIPSTNATFAPTEVTFPTPSPTVAPSKPPSLCKTVDKVVCDNPDFSILCGSLESTGITDSLTTGTWTLFAPNNEAFLKLPPDYVQIVTSDPSALSFLLLFHTVQNEALRRDDLPCVAGQNLTPMANGKDTRTLCDDISPGVAVPRYQKGNFNPKDNAPEFLAFDIEACNGVVHELDGVMLFHQIEPTD